MDILSLFYSALIHDFKHPGFTNMFLINTHSEIAYYYNGIYTYITIDKSPLENYHLAEAFKLLRNKDLDIFDKLSSEEFKILRKRTIECVLATDMSFHSKHVGLIATKITIYQHEGKGKEFLPFFLDDQNCNKFEFQQEFMNYFLHLADIGHSAKPWETEVKWSDLIFEEFFKQGDIERSMKLPISFLCDRHTTNIAKSQIGFIKNIVLPSFYSVNKILSILDVYITYINKNLEKWQEKELNDC